MARRRYWRNSLRGRVTLVATLLLTAVLMAAGIALAALTRNSLTHDVRTDLTDQVTEIMLLARQGQLTPVVAATGVRTGQVQVIDDSGTTIAASAGIASRDHFAVIPPPVGRATSEATVDGSKIGRRGGDRFLIVARNVDTPSGPVVVYGASSLRSVDRAVHTITVSLFVGIPLLLVIAAILLWRSVGRALRPVETMRSEVEEIESTSLDRRVSAPSSDDEIARLAVTLNGMLARLDAARQRERRFAADASHELRSPLAAARTQLEVALAYPDRADWSGTARDVLIELDRLDGLARDLLRIAKSDAGAGRRSEVIDLGQLAAEQVASFSGPLHPVALVTPADPVSVNGDPELLVRVMRNLLANAERHAAGHVTVTVTKEGSTAVLDVSNDGASVPDDQRERIFEPFTRLDDARSADEGGAGLGLAIARRIAEDHRGTLTCEVVSTGAQFSLRLPAAGAEKVPSGIARRANH